MKRICGVTKKYKEQKILLWSMPLVLIFGLLYTNYDGTAITKWGILFLDAIRHGDLGNYPQRVLDIYGSATNYSLFVNLITAVWLSPLYLFCEMVMHTDNIVLYELWYKCLLILALFLDMKVFGKVLQSFGFDKEKVVIGQFLLITSAVSLISALGKGQVDVYGLFFFLKGMEYQLQEKHIKMSLCMGVAFLIKPLVLWILIPCYILLLGREKKKTVLYVGICFIPFLIDKLITIILMPEYITISHETAQMLKKEFGGLSMFESLFYGGVNDTLPFWMLSIVICFVCYYVSTHHIVKTWHCLVMPVTILLLFSIFCSVSYHWFIYIIPILVIMILKLQKIQDGYLLMLGVNTSLTCYFLVGELLILLPTVQGSVYGSMHEIHYFGMQILQQYRWMLFPVFKTAFFTCILVILGLFSYEAIKDSKDSQTDEQEKDGYKVTMLLLQILPLFGYIILTIIKYLM